MCECECDFVNIETAWREATPVRDATYEDRLRWIMEGAVRDARARPVTPHGYQARAAKTAIYPGRDTDDGLTYCALGLSGEAGEVADLVKKYLRDGTFDIDAFRKELGDVLWYLSSLCGELGLSLQDVARSNLEKLADRQRRGVLGGSGDNR